MEDLVPLLELDLALEEEVVHMLGCEFLGTLAVVVVADTWQVYSSLVVV